MTRRSSRGAANSARRNRCGPICGRLIKATANFGFVRGPWRRSTCGTVRPFPQRLLAASPGNRKPPSGICREEVRGMS